MLLEMMAAWLHLQEHRIWIPWSQAKSSAALTMSSEKPERSNEEEIK